jgi:lysyl-tRNA synthetase class 1
MTGKKYEFWLDKWARKIIEREKKLKRGLKILRTESGLGASGIPHIGSFGDVARQFGVTLALRDLGFKSEVIAYSDDRDGLRKVPFEMPDWLEKYIGAPVSNIPDPFGKCHASFGQHMTSQLLDALDKAGIDYNFNSGSENYRKGILDKEIENILLNADKAGRIIKKMVGQKKFVETLPYFPLCEKCGKMYTTRAYKLLPKEHKVLYVCDQDFTGVNSNTGKKILVKACGHIGEASYFKGEGKLSWKVEFAARWSALKIVFEAHGKDILDSVKVNNKICSEILNWDPPFHLMYEMFLEKGGKKISKSFGGVFTPQMWLRYGSPESFILLMFKRSGMIREIDVNDIPTYMREVDRLEDVYFGKEKLDNPRDEFNAKRLFEFINKLKPPNKLSEHIPYDYLVELASVAPEKNKLYFVVQKLLETGHVSKVNEKVKKEIKKKFAYAENWFNDFVKPEEVKVELSKDEKTAIKELIQEIKKEKDGEKLQNKIFEVAKSQRIKPTKFFGLIYKIILNRERGPRLGPYIIDRGKGEIIKLLENSIKS